MDHADARAWLDEAFFEPGSLARLEDTVDLGSDAADHQLVAVREHLAACADCAAYTQSLWRTALTLDLAAGPSEGAKPRVLAAVKSVGRQRGSVGRQRTSVGIRGMWWRQVLSPRLAAVLIVVALVGGIVGGVWGLSAQRSTADKGFIAAVGMVAELAGDPESKSVALRDASGQNIGAAFVSNATGRIAVFAGPLGTGGAEEWKCYLVRDGHITELGPMDASAGVSYWAGWLLSVPDAGRPGDQLTIAMDEESAPALVGTF